MASTARHRVLTFIAASGVGLMACSQLSEDGSRSSSTTFQPAANVSAAAEPLKLPSELGVRDEVELSCPGSLAAPPDDFEQVLEVVALPTGSFYPTALRTSVQDADDGTQYYFAKAGLWWRGDAAFELVVPEELTAVLAIGWGGPADLAHRVTVDCGLDDAWMVQPGGYWVREPMCAELLVRSNGVEQAIELGLGAPCAGQSPPIEPSDG